MTDSTGTNEIFPDLSRLLAPGSIAVIGASDRPGNIGGTAIRHLLKFGYPGALWPVNPKQQTVAGLPCFPNPRELPAVPDLAIFAVSAPAVVDAVQRCAEAGIRHGIVWAGGFAEGGGEGVERHRALVDLCRQTGFRLCGPNCLGIINADLPMTATFASSLLEIDRFTPGAISMVSQSGGMSTIAQATAHRAGFGFRYVISSGNEAVLTVADFIHALVQDEGTRIIAAYLEGVRDGAKFLTALEEARERGKPVILLKAGASAASARAAMAHTGALAGEDRVFDAIFREMAVIRVFSLEELVDVAMLLSGIDRAKLPRGSRVMVLTSGGGSGVLAADQCTQHGLSVPPLEDATVERVRPLVTPLAALGNPSDITPETYNQPAWLALLPQALDVIAADPNVDAVLFMCGAMAHRAREIMDVVCDFRDRADKPIFVSWALTPRSVEESLPAKRIHPFPEAGRAVRAMGRLARHRADLSRPPRPAMVELPDFDWSALVEDPAPGTVISEHECHRMLAAAGLPVAAGTLATSVEEAEAAARTVGYPVVLKGITGAVTHRAAAGLLALDLRSRREVRGAYRRLVGRAGEVGVALDGVYVQHLVRGGQELLVSAFRDSQFGVMVACGAGGNLTELIDDVTVERAPVDGALARHMLGRLRMLGLAERHGGTSDLGAVAGFVAHFSRLAATAPWRRFVLEVNPIKWTSEGAVAVDGLLIVEEP